MSPNSHQGQRDQDIVLSDEEMDSRSPSSQSQDSDIESTIIRRAATDDLNRTLRLLNQSPVTEKIRRNSKSMKLKMQKFIDSITAVFQTTVKHPIPENRTECNTEVFRYFSTFLLVS